MCLLLHCDTCVINYALLRNIFVVCYLRTMYQKQASFPSSASWIVANPRPKLVKNPVATKSIGKIMANGILLYATTGLHQVGPDHFGQNQGSLLCPPTSDRRQVRMYETIRWTPHSKKNNGQDDCIKKSPLWNPSSVATDGLPHEYTSHL